MSRQDIMIHKNTYPNLSLALALLFTIQCTHIPQNGSMDRAPNVATDRTPNVALVPQSKIIGLPYTQNEPQLQKNIPDDWISVLPGNDQDYYEQIRRAIKYNKKNKLSDVALNTASRRIAKYVSFVMYNYPNSVTKKLVSDKLISRLMDSSVQFILCANLEDFACLEQTPLITPTSFQRAEDPKLKLGQAVEIQDELEKNMEYYFNEQIFTPESQYDPNKGVAQILEQKIKSIGNDPDKDGLYMAIYGMDDITKTQNAVGSLNGVYTSIVQKIDSGIPVYGVFDQAGAQPTAIKPLIYSYVRPPDEKLSQWILSPLNSQTQSPTPNEKTASSDLTNLNFQYNGGTQGLIKKLSENIKSDDEARGRIEWRNNGIMHNKFFIFKQNNKMSVWTGTANISRTCLGTERNSNMSVIIHNDEVAKSYLTEFKEMFTFQDPKYVKPETTKDFIGLNDPKYFPRGRFHSAKTPNTKRYFKFLKDQTDLRLYFSPTDDAEHRALLPMILSARSGDKLLISMFGAAGIEYSRAIQWAMARGVQIKVLVDSPTACGPGSWAGRTGDATLLELNPYRGLFPNVTQIEIRKNDKNAGEIWKQNHQKIGLLLRKKSDGLLQAEYLTFGSQNWSQSGNDSNDENLIILRRENGPLKIGASFQNHFESYLWPKSLNIPAKGCSDNSSSEPPAPDGE